MAENSKIEWCDSTANLWQGCTHVSSGCDHCYAETLSHRWGKSLWGANAPRMATKSVWSDLASYQRKSEALGAVHRVFVGSLMDIFEKPMCLVDHRNDPVMHELGNGQDTTATLRHRLFDEVTAGYYPNLDFLLLTKRPSNIAQFIPPIWNTYHYSQPNVMFGCTVVSLKELRLVDQLRDQAPGRRFLSIEPQLEYIPDIDLTGIAWVINGGESGPRKRPFDPAWARRLRDICAEQNVPFFMKQINKIDPIPDDLLIRQFPPLPVF